MTLPVAVPSVPGHVRRAVATAACFGTSIWTTILPAGAEPTLLQRLSTAIGLTITQYSQSGAPIVGGAYSLQGQITEALAVGYDCYVLDGDSPAGEYLNGGHGYTYDQCGEAYGVQLDRLHAVGALVITCRRGVGFTGGVNWGAGLRGPVGAAYAARPWLRVADIWTLQGQTDNLADSMPLFPGHVVGDCYGDGAPSCDHYTAYGAQMVADEMARVFRRYARVTA